MQVKLRWMAALAVWVCGATAAFGADDLLIPGDYVTAGASHYENGSVRITEQGFGYKMTATLVRGNHRYETEAYLDVVSPYTLRGSGYITVRYSENTGCRHRFGVRIQVKDGRLWLYENTPRYIPYNPNGPCQPAGPYEWFHHEAPYSYEG